MRTSLLIALFWVVGIWAAVPDAQGGNLLVNGDFSAGNTGFTSGYNHVPNGSFTAPGDYGVITNPAVAFTNGYASFGDHTTGTGLMMFGDGAGSQTPFWSETVESLPTPSTSSMVGRLLPTLPIRPSYNFRRTVPRSAVAFQSTRRRPAIGKSLRGA